MEIRHGNRQTIGFKNETNVPLYLSVLLFDSVWGISQVFPIDKDCEEVDWKKQFFFEIDFDFPHDIFSDSSVSDLCVFETLKAFVTTKPASFRSLETGGVGQQSGMGRLASRTFTSTDIDLRHTLATFDKPQDWTVRGLNEETRSFRKRPGRPVRRSGTADMANS